MTFPTRAYTSIVIASGGVQPGSVTFTNTTTAYSFTGGAISGSATVTLSGTGSVTFLNANTYSGGTDILAGNAEDQQRFCPGKRHGQRGGDHAARELQLQGGITVTCYRFDRRYPKA